MLKKFLFIITILNLLFLVFILSCTKKITKTDNVNTVDKNTSTADKNSLDDIDKKYLTEGFISKDIFRIVIVATKEESKENADGIQDKAKKRSLMTLQKYLTSENRKFDQNVRAEILNLINNNSQFEKKDLDYVKNDVYYFDIKKKNIKDHIKNISMP